MSQLTTEQVLQMIQEYAERGEPVDLRGCNLSDIDLSWETVQQYRDRYPRAVPANLGGVGLTEAHLEEAWLGGAHLEGAWLGGAHLKGARLGGAHLERATLVGPHLEGAEDIAGAGLGGAHLEGAFLFMARLDGAQLGVAHLEGARIGGAHLERAELNGSALRAAYFVNVYLDRTRFTRAELGRQVEKKGDEEVFVDDEPLIGEEAEGNWAAAKEAYLAIKQNFQSLGRYEDARWAYVKERRMERKTFFWAEGGSWRVREAFNSLAENHWKRRHVPSFYVWWLRLKHQVWPWSWNGFQDITASYGENPLKPFAWGLAIIAAWSLLYALVGINLMEDGNSGITHNWWPDGIAFSLRSFATMAFNDLQPGNVAAKLLSAVEAMLGVSTLALVMYCLGRRMSGS